MFLQRKIPLADNEGYTLLFRLMDGSVKRITEDKSVDLGDDVSIPIGLFSAEDGENQRDGRC
jgi:hypothetical protein